MAFPAATTGQVPAATAPYPTDRGTGELTIAILLGGDGLRRTWSDTATGNVEDQVSEVIDSLAPASAKHRDDDCRRAQEQRQQRGHHATRTAATL